MEEYIKNSIAKYLEDLSGRRIAPGGGSAAALTAALGVGLSLMAINYSIKEGAGGDLLSVKSRQEENLERLASLVDEDCRVFSRLMETLALKEPAEEEYVAAAKVPMEVCRRCGSAITGTLAVIGNVNRNLLTDIGCASHTLKAAFHAARLNVAINLDKIKDRSFVEGTEKELQLLKNNIDGASRKIETEVSHTAK